MGDNGNDNVTPVSGVNVVVKNGHNVKNASAAHDYNVPAVTFDGDKDSYSITGGARPGSPMPWKKIGVQVRVEVSRKKGGGG